MSKSLSIDNTLGDAPQALSDKVKEYFDNTQSPVPNALAELNALIGFPYQLEIDWQSIRENTPHDLIDDGTLSDLVCSSTHHFLKELLRLLEDDDEFSENFLEKTKVNGRRISVNIHSISSIPFSRLKEDAVSPTLELFLPMIGRNTVIKEITSSCGKDLPSALRGLSELDPLKSWSTDKGFLPRVKDLPRPGLALSRGPIFIRINESLDKERFEIEGNPPVVELIQDYIFKHANNRYGMDFTLWSKSLRLGQGVSILQVANSNSHQCLSPMVVISLLEGSLGFTRIGEPVATASKLIWFFQREKPFLIL